MSSDDHITVRDWRRKPPRRLHMRRIQGPASSPYQSGRSPHWLKAKKPESPAARREVLEDWGRKRRW